MNSRKNPSLGRLVSSLLLSATLVASLSGCSSIFRRGESDDNADEPAEKTARNANEYAATESDSEPSRDLKDRKIEGLQATVASLNSRIRELESKLQASQNRPNLDARLQKTPTAQPGRQVSDVLSPSVASNDPGAGVANDANVRAFQQGKILFDQEKYPEAVLALSAFLERNETHPLAGTAQYYIGESYYQQGDFTVADQEFQKLALRYPLSARLSWALLRLADCADKTGRPDDARRYRLQTEGLYSKSPALKDAAFRASAVTPIVPTGNAAAPIATAPDSPNSADSGPAVPSLAIEKPTAPTAPTAPRLEGSDLDSPPGAGI
jgi:TolA-binding protein